MGQVVQYPFLTSWVSSLLWRVDISIKIGYKHDLFTNLSKTNETQSNSNKSNSKYYYSAEIGVARQLQQTTTHTIFHWHSPGRFLSDRSLFTWRGSRPVRNSPCSQTPVPHCWYCTIRYSKYCMYRSYGMFSMRRMYNMYIIYGPYAMYSTYGTYVRMYLVHNLKYAEHIQHIIKYYPFLTTTVTLWTNACLFQPKKVPAASLLSRTYINQYWFVCPTWQYKQGTIY